MRGQYSAQKIAHSTMGTQAMSANDDLDLLRRISAEWVTSKTLRQEAGHRLGVMVAIFEQLDDKAQRGELPDDWKVTE